MTRYNYKIVEALYKRLGKAVRSGKADELQAKTFVAAGHVLDLADIVADMPGTAQLDFTSGTEDALAPAVGMVHSLNLKAGKSAEESREDIVKKLASYELFSITNSFALEGGEAEVALHGGELAVEVPKEGGDTAFFDVYPVMRKTIAAYVLADAYDPNGVVSHGTMGPFYDELVQGFIEKLD